MDSSESAEDASSIEELSYQNYMSNLPPIESVNTTYPLNPPPLAFASPRDNSQYSKIYPTEYGIDSLDVYKKSICRTEKDLDSQNHASFARPLRTDDSLAKLQTGELLQSTEVDELENIEGDDAQCCEKEGGMSRRCLQFEGAVARNVTSFLPQPLIFSSRERVELYLQDQRNSTRHAANTCSGLQRVNHEIYPLVQPITSFPPASHVYDQRKLTYESAPNPEQFNRPRSPSKKKQRMSSNTGGGSCKQCNCKKSQCVKLYCECFQACNYCDVDCACEGCINKPEYEDMVMERKLQITSRNPLAFCPKTEEVRHRRGCNCRVSKCSKNYCECFQANVRCSSACRCDGCDNRPGKEAGYPRAEHVSSEPSLRSILGDSKLHNNMKMVTDQRDSIHDLHHPTASLQFSGQVKYLPPPQVGTATCPSEWTFSEMSLVPERNEILESGTYGWPLDSNMEMMNQTSSGSCNSVPSLYQPTLSPSRSIIFSASVGQRPMTGFGETRHTHLEWNCISIDKIVGDLKLYDVALTPTGSGKLTSSDQVPVSPPGCHLRQLGSDSSGHLRSNTVVNFMPSRPSSPPPSRDGSDGSDHQDWGNSTDM